jgi:hypothetical protein
MVCLAPWTVCSTLGRRGPPAQGGAGMACRRAPAALYSQSGTWLGEGVDTGQVHWVCGCVRVLVHVCIE